MSHICLAKGRYIEPLMMEDCSEVVCNVLVCECAI